MGQPWRTDRSTHSFSSSTGCMIAVRGASLGSSSIAAEEPCSRCRQVHTQGLQRIGRVLGGHQGNFIGVLRRSSTLLPSSLKQRLINWVHNGCQGRALGSHTAIAEAPYNAVKTCPQVEHDCEYQLYASKVTAVAHCRHCHSRSCMSWLQLDHKPGRCSASAGTCLGVQLALDLLQCDLAEACCCAFKAVHCTIWQQADADETD